MLPSIPTTSLPSLFFLCSTLLSSSTAQSTRSPKRGLAYVNPSSPSDDQIWSAPSTSLTWYYNYKYAPTNSLTSSAHLQFVPMLWGATTTPTTPDPAFTSSIERLFSTARDSPQTLNLSHVLSFNEPDGPASTGGSDISPRAAAESYLTNLLPLREAPYHLRVSVPAVTGSPTGLTWLQDFNASCLVLNPDAGCPADFLPVHWYGNFEGLASHMGQLRGLYPALPMWITEYGLPNAELEETQAFYNVSAEYFDRLDYVERYSYFGAFRSDTSNVGPNAAFLDDEGALTDMGSWYLGGGATGKVPKGEAAGGRGGSSVAGVVAVGLVASLWSLTFGG